MADMKPDVDLLREIADTLDGCEWEHPLGSAAHVRWAAEKIERLRGELNIERERTDAAIKRILDYQETSESDAVIVGECERDNARLKQEIKRLRDAIYSLASIPQEQARQIDPVLFLQTRVVSVEQYNELVRQRDEAREALTTLRAASEKAASAPGIDWIVEQCELASVLVAMDKEVTKEVNDA